MESQNIIVAVRVRPPNDREKAYGSECTISMDGCHTVIGGPDKEHKFKFDHSFWSMNEKDPHFADQEHVFHHMGVPLLHRAFEGYNCCLFAYGQTGEHIYHHMGARLLHRALHGYNCCPVCFSYGQAGVRWCNPAFERVRSALQTPPTELWLFSLPRKLLARHDTRHARTHTHTHARQPRINLLGSGKSYTMMGERDQRGIIPRFAKRMYEMIATKPKIEFKVEISYFEIYAEQIFDLLVSI